MKVTQISMGYVETNTYILSNGDECIVIDPCLDPGNNAKRLLNALKGKSVQGILLTHGHFDHISGVDALVNVYECPVYMPYDALDWLKNPLKNLSSQMPEVVSIQSTVEGVKGSELTVGDFTFKVEKNPGHTSHDVSYIIEDMAFVGDFIMNQTIGRTDLPTGSMNAMNDSIQKFMKNHDSLYLYPGHGNITTLEDEIKYNPFLKSKKS